MLPCAGDGRGAFWDIGGSALFISCLCIVDAGRGERVLGQPRGTPGQRSIGAPLLAPASC